MIKTCQSIAIAAFCCSLLITGCSSDSGLNTPLDGSSQDAFNQSLLSVQDQLSEDQFEQLKWAVGYLKVNTIDNTSVDGFYHGLDKASPSELIERAKQLQAQLENR